MPRTAVGLMIFLDVVYNHFGPDGNYLSLYAPQFFREDRRTPWGAAIDFRRPEVRDFFTDNVLYWLMEYRFDGLRFDAVHAIVDQDWVDEMAAQVRATVEPGRHVHLVLEHHNDASHLGKDIDAQWNDDGHNVLHVLLTGEDGGYYLDYADQPAWKLARCLAEGFIYQGEHRRYTGEPRGMPSAHLPPTAFVLFLQNHDQIGNRAFGERLTTLAEPAALEAAIALLLLCPQIPLLFMGEECASRTPFLFFTDHGAELADAVREGRRGEFAKFHEFADPASRERIPDPNAAGDLCRFRPAGGPCTWAGARGALPPSDRTARDGDRAATGWRAHALAAEAIGPKAVVARWRLGDGAVLTLATNLDRKPVPIDLPAGRLLFASHAMPPGRLPGHSTCAFLDSHTLTMTDEAIRDLARRAGIAVEWNDYAGRPKTVAPDVLRHMLEALGLPCCNARRPAREPQAVAAALHRAGAAAADHRDGRTADAARRRCERTATGAAEPRSRRHARSRRSRRCADGCACPRSARPAIIGC